MRLLNLFEDSGHVYQVVVENNKRMNLAFKIRKDAREYKRSLAKSCEALSAKIIKHEFVSGYELPEKEVT